MLKHIKVWLLIGWVLFTVFCVIESLATPAKAQTQASYETQFLNNASDPATPSARYVLDKLNKHLSNSIAEDDAADNKIAQLQTKLGELQYLPVKVAVLSERQETDSWLLKAVLGGIATLIGKEIIEMLKKRNV